MQLRRSILTLTRRVCIPSASRAVSIVTAHSTRWTPSRLTRQMSTPTDPSADAAAPVAAATETAAAASAATDLWDPTQYLLFDEARARPGHDLLQRVQTTLSHWRLPAPQRVFDLGCGPGKQVALLARAFPEAKITGVDSSANMIAAAQAATDKLADAELSARVQFQQDTFEGFTDSNGVDLLYTNAALHWSHDHSNLFPHLVQQLRADGGVLAVQMPNNFREPSHTCMRRALEEGAFFDPDELDAVWANQPDVHEQGASHYWHLLAPHCRHVDAWQTEYQQLISSPTRYHPVLEWTKSTALAPLLAALPTDSERTRFQELYSLLLEEAYPIFEKNGKPHTLFPFKRIFLIAVR